MNCLKYLWSLILIGCAVTFLNCESVTAANVRGASAKEELKVKLPNGEELLSVRVTGDNVTLTMKHQILRGNLHSVGKRKYEGSGKGWEVKSEEDGFKLRTLQGQLLWKVKFYGNKIKISDNEENQKAFVMTRKEDVAKIQRETNALGTLTLVDQTQMQVASAHGKEFGVNVPAFSLAPGVLLMKEIPEQQRWILLAEIFARHQ